MPTGQRADSEPPASAAQTANGNRQLWSPIYVPFDGGRRHPLYPPPLVPPLWTSDLAPLLRHAIGNVPASGMRVKGRRRLSASIVVYDAKRNHQQAETEALNQARHTG